MSKDYNVLDGLTPKTVELHRAIFDKGYEQGFNEGQAHQLASDDVFRESCEKSAYEKGLNDAWEYAKKIVCDKSQNSYSLYTLKEIFGTASISDIFLNFSPSEATSKIREYEEKQKADGEIKVGDEVESIYGTNIGKKYIITKVVNQDYANVLAHDGEVGFINPSKYKKTGKYFDQIAEVLGHLEEAQDEDNTSAG